MIRSRSIAAARPARVLLLAAAALLGGCNSEYTVRVHNEGARPVRVRLMQERLMSDAVALASAQVPPGQEIKLGPVKATATDDVLLEVDGGEMGIPAGKQRLYPGTSEYRVGGGGDMTWGPPAITEVGEKARSADGK